MTTTLGSRQLSAATILLLFAVLPLSSQIHAPNPIQPPNRAYRPKRMGLAKWEPTPQEVQASYWSLEPGWNTELEIRNNLAERNLTVIPTLRTAAGREIALAPVSLASEQIVAIDLRSAVASVAPEIVNSTGSFGSVAVRFGGLDGANVFAASVVHRDGHPIDFHFDGYDAASNAGYYSGIEGIWWVPTGAATDYLIIANPSPKMVKGILRLTSPSGPSTQRALILGPHQTTRIDIREVLGPSANGSMGGLTLSLPQREGISATEIIFDETTGFTAIMKLFERYAKEQVASHVLRAPMMALSQPDPSLAFPQNTALVPRLFLRNAGPSGLPVSLAVDWRSQNASGTYQFPLLHLKPGELRTVELGKAQASGLIPEDAHWGTVRVSYAGNSADLVPVALSYDSTNRYGLQTPFTEGTSRMFKGSMWHVDPTHNTLLTTGNGGSEATTAQVTLFYNGGQGRYRVEKVLQPGQQLWLDVGQLIHNQVPDSDGKTLPPDTMTGSYELRDLDHAAVGLLYEGKLIIDKTYGHGSYGCGTCCGYLKAELIPNPFAGPPSISNNDTYEAEEQCGGYWDDFTINASGWNSSNTAVVTLPNRTLHTLAVGTATGGAEAYLQGSKPAPACPMIWIAAQQQENVVTASFSSLVGIVQGQTANVTVTLRPSPSPVTVTLSLTTTTGTGSAVFTSTNTNTTSITQTSTITIKGVTASSTANNIRLSASALGSTLNSNLNFSVIWVTIANIYTSGSLQGDDDAANQYAVSNGTTQLNGLGPAYDGAEIKGVVTPSNFTDTITLTQTRVSYACYSDTSNGSTLASSCSNGLPSSYTCPSSDYTQCQVDATGPSGSEDSTPAPNGNIYSWDAPGTTPGSTPNTISRIRQNFAIFAVYKNVTASNVFTWFNRGSAKRNSDGSITWENTYNTSGDNQAGQGNTKTSYNLQ